MKKLIPIYLLLLTVTAFGQDLQSEIPNTKIYLKGIYSCKKNELILLQTRTNLKDTIINNTKYLKFQADYFTDYSNKQYSQIYYETFANGIYESLDKNLDVVDKINYQTTKEQQGIIFGKQTKISLAFIDTLQNFPRDSLIPTEKTPRKYFQADSSEIYIVIIPDLKTIAVSSNGILYSKLLLGDIYKDISKGLQYNYKTSSRFDIQVGDEIQLFYRRKWYNDTTNLVEYQDKQFKNIKYVGDTIINNTKTLKLETEGYNFMSGSISNAEVYLVSVTDSGYYQENQFVPFKEYKTEYKISGNNGSNVFFLQGVIYDTVGSYIYPKIALGKSDEPFWYFILPFFPFFYTEFGNVEGIVTYSKLKGIEKGIKRQKKYITNETNLREIICRAQNEVEVILYFTDSADVDMQILDFDTKQILGEEKSSAKQGLNSFIIHTNKLEKGKEYRVLINYQGTSSSGSFSDNVKEVF